MNRPFFAVTLCRGLREKYFSARVYDTLFLCIAVMKAVAL
jgi:hypothetical protein